MAATRVEAFVLLVGKQCTFNSLGNKFVSAFRVLSRLFDVGRVALRTSDDFFRWWGQAAYLDSLIALWQGAVPLLLVFCLHSVFASRLRDAL